MNYIFRVDGGGLFSRLLQCAIIPLADKQFEKVYLTAQPLPPTDLVDDHVKPGIQFVHDTVQLLQENQVIDPWDNIFNFILDQEHDHSYVHGGLLPVGKFYDHQYRIEHSANYKQYKNVFQRLRIRQSILNSVNPVIGHDVLGVHVRLKDANSVDDPKIFDDYVQAIDQNLNDHNYSKIFVSADNSISIRKLEELYPDMILSNQLARSDNESADSFIWEYKNYFRRHYWVDAMIDCLSLSKCHTLICKNSNFSNAAIVFGDFQHIHRLTN